jgi:hypothetical protein
MNRYALLSAMGLAGFMWVCGNGSAQEASSRDVGQVVYQDEPPAVAEPGYTWVREIRYKVVRHPYCKKVPEKVYSWVYAERPDYYCLPPTLLQMCRGKHNGDGCPGCQGPFYRPQLKKMQVERIISWNCVLDYVTEQVPCVAWRKVPIGAQAETGNGLEGNQGPMPGLPPDDKSGAGKPGPMPPLQDRAPSGSPR